MNSFDHLIKSLTEEDSASIFSPISETEFRDFLKEATFEVIKGKKLGMLFQEKFNIRDRVLSIYSDDAMVIRHIRYCKYVK